MSIHSTTRVKEYRGNNHRWNPDRPSARYCTVLTGHTSPVEKAAFNPAKESELCSVDSEGNAKFWDVKTKAVLNEVTGLGFALSLAWSPDGSHCIIGNKVRKRRFI